MKISVIVPVYNSEKYIERCVESILAQTYQNWELILVDDGSKDQSFSLLKQYENQDERIRVYQQENSGPGIARNTGMGMATGDYIVFIDSDDRVYNTYFESLSKKTEDVVFIDINQVNEQFKVLKTEYMSQYQGLSKDVFLRRQMTGRINWGGVRKAVKSQLLHDNKIEYSEHKIGEEAIYSFMLLWHAKTFSFIDGPVYEYVNREGSQSDLRLDDPWGGVALALKEKVTQMGIYQKYANTINAFMATSAIVSLDKLAQKYSYKEYRKNGRQRVRDYYANTDRQHKVDYSNMDKKALVLYPFLRLKWVTPIYLISRFRSMCRRR